MVGPMARPGARGPSLRLKYEIALRAGPGLDIIVAGRPGPGPHNSICGPRPGLQNCCGPGPQIMFPGLGLDCRPVQGPRSCAFEQLVRIRSTLGFKRIHFHGDWRLNAGVELRDSEQVAFCSNASSFSTTHAGTLRSSLRRRATSCRKTQARCQQPVAQRPKPTWGRLNLYIY